MMRAALLALIAPAALLQLGGCAAHSVPPPAAAPPRPAPISHIVFIKLKNPTDADELVRDCDARLASIPAVSSYACGRHLDTGRPTVDAAYDVGLYIGFETEADYAVYVDHPSHVALVRDWAPRAEWLRVHDVLDETP